MITHPPITHTPAHLTTAAFTDIFKEVLEYQQVILQKLLKYVCVCVICVGGCSCSCYVFDYQNKYRLLYLHSEDIFSHPSQLQKTERSHLGFRIEFRVKFRFRLRFSSSIGPHKSLCLCRLRNCCFLASQVSLVMNDCDNE